MQGKLPDYNEPVVVPLHKATLEDFCNRIHKTFIKQFKYALVWGTSTKHRPQKVRVPEIAQKLSQLIRLHCCLAGWVHRTRSYVWCDYVLSCDGMHKSSIYGLLYGCASLRACANLIA